jgi:ATP-dependent helicase/nuclease subunit A
MKKDGASMQLTEEQKAIVAAPVGNLLVSAAAGSGKTAVMTDRIVARMIDKQLDMNQVLVMTFTDAAASQMKEKIQRKLQAALAETRDPDLRRYLSRQLTLLPGAAISTIHAFCLTVIRNFCHLAVDDQGLPIVEPGFTIGDGLNAGLLCRQALDEIMAERYEQIDRAEPESLPDWTTDFYRLVDSFGSGRSDENLREMALRLYQFFRSMPDYRLLIDQYRSKLQAVAADFATSQHARVLLNQLQLLVVRATAAGDTLRAMLDSGVTFIKQADRNRGYHNQFRTILQTLADIGDYLAGGQLDWDEVRALSLPLQTELALPKANAKDPDRQTFLDIFRSQVAEAIFCLSGNCGSKTYSDHFQFDTRFLFARPAADIAADVQVMRPVIDQLFNLILDLDEHYRELKRSQSLIDFGDFEHLALGILRQPEAHDYYRQRFREIYIDEYQDTSSIQETLLQAIGQANVFMVGDIKQSIYRFRHARPQIFMAKSESFQDPELGSLYTLNKNFRSVTGILAGVNELFSQLMTPQAGEIRYDETQALVAHRPAQDGIPPIELLLMDSRLPPAAADPDSGNGAPDGDLDPDGDRDFDSAGDLDQELSDDGLMAQAEWILPAAELNQYQKEALAVLARIRELLAASHSPGDIVILSRSKAVGRVFSDALAEDGIATLEDTKGGFLDSPELRLMEALLQVFDNPRQDIPLAAVMLSGIFAGGFSASELYQVRLADCQQPRRSRFFHEAVRWYADAGPDPVLKQKLAAFLAWIELWRDRERILRLSEWLEMLFEETGYLSQVAATPNGAAKVRELRQFGYWAGQFENQRQVGLFSFVRYLDTLRERGVDESPFGMEEPVQAAVRVMTIHRSKGLEFPVVFLVGTQADIAPKSRRDPLLISETLGVGFDLIDPDRQIRYPTHLKLAMLEEYKAAGLAEEMRLLYVAMTRAKDRLIISAALKLDPEKGVPRLTQLIEQSRAQSGLDLPAHRVLSCRSYLDWIILALARHPDLDWARLAPAADTGYQLQPASKGVWHVRWEAMTSELATASLQAMTSLPVTTTNPAAPSAVAAVPATPGQKLRQWLELPVVAEDPLYLAAEQRLYGEYRFGQAARTPIKLAVSELKRREQEEARFADDQAIPVPIAGQVDQASDQTFNQADQARPLGINLTLHDLRPAFEGQAEDISSGAGLGTLLHRFMRFINLGAAVRQPDRQEILHQVQTMAAQHILSADEARTLLPHVDDLVAFAQSSLASQMLAAAVERQALHREMPFTLALPVGDVYPGQAGFAPDDRVLIQGIIDCWFIQDNGAVLVDYKSDWIAGDDQTCQQVLAERYTRQLAYYARAIEAATLQPVRRKLIWHIRRRQIFELD